MKEGRRFEDLRKRWEDRAKLFGNHTAGVLYQGLSSSLNNYIDAFHLGCLKQSLLDRLPRNTCLIDVGCGYGRISQAIRRERPDIEIIGCDFSLPYCHLFSRDLAAPTVCCQIDNMPFAARTFDAAAVVTSLMYIRQELRQHVASGILDLLRPGGLVLFIEPSQEVLEIIGAIRPNSGRATTGGTGLAVREFRELRLAGNFEEIAHGGIPVFTLFLPALVLLDKLPRLQRALLSIIAKADQLAYRFWRISLQRWVLLRRVHQA